MTINDNPFVVPGLTGGTLPVDDISNPIYGKALTTFDAFLGSSRRLFMQRNVMWRVQLNVRNLFNDRDLLLQQASATGITGYGAIFIAQQRCSLILTITFSF